MNKIYKVIWNKAKNCYVVVSEIAKAHSKGGSTVRRVPHVGTILTTMLLASILSFGYVAPVWADATITGVASGEGLTPTTLATNQAGEGIAVTQEDGIITVSAEEDDTLKFLKKYMKFNATYPDSNPESSDPIPVVDARSNSSFALGQGAQISVISGDDKRSKDNLAIGSNTEIYADETGMNTVIGANAVAGARTDSVGNGIYTSYSTAIGSKSRVYGSHSISIGEEAQVGRKTKIGENSDSIPIYAYVDDSIAIGFNAKSYSDQSIAIGKASQAGKTGGTSYTDRNNAEPKTTAEATAIGFNAHAEANLSTALGAETNALDKSSTAVGANAQAKSTNSTAIGTSSNATNSNSTAIGAYSNASGSSGTAIGINTKASNTNSTAVGSGARAYGAQSSAIGASTVAVGKQNVAVGTGSEAKKNETMALGFHAAAVHAESIAVGHDSVTFGDGSVAIGHLTVTGMPVKEGYHEASDTKYISLPTNSKISNDSKLYIQTSDGTVLLYESSVDASGKEKGTYYKVKAVPVVDGNSTSWKFVKVDKNGNETTNNAVQYLAQESKAKDIRDPQFASDAVNHIDYFYAIDENRKKIPGTETNPLDGGIAIGSYTAAQGEKSLAVGLTSAAYGKNSIAQGLYASSYGEGAIAFGHETTSGAHAKIVPNANIPDAHTTEFSVSSTGITERTLVDGSVVGVDKNSEYTIKDTSGTNITVNSNGKITAIGGSNVDFSGASITLQNGTPVARDTATGHYYYTDAGSQKVVGDSEKLTFSKGSQSVTVTAGQMTLSQGGISFGSYSHAEGDRSMAIGRVSGSYDKNSTAVGLYANAYGEGSMAIGHNATTGAKVTVETLDNDYHTVALQLDENGNGKRSYLKEVNPETGAITETSTPTQGGIAIGSYAHASGDRAIAFGRAAGAYDRNSTAFGIYANALGDGSMAMGHGASTGVKATVVKGTVDEFWTTTLNTDTTTGNPIFNGKDGGIAIGSYAHTEGERALAVGRVSGAYGTNSTAIGLRSNAYGEGSIAFGHGVVAGNEKDPYAKQIDALHNDPYVDYDLDGVQKTYTDSEGNVHTIEINPNNVVGAIAFGSYAKATARGSLSVGRYSEANSPFSTAMGIRAKVGTNAENGIAIGREAKVVTPYQKDNNGNVVTDADGNPVEAPYGGGNSIAVGALTTVTGQNSIAIGTTIFDGTDATTGESILLGPDDRKPTTVTGDFSLAIGRNDTVAGDSSIAIGDKSAVTGNKSIAIGTENTVKGDGSGAIGDPNVVVGDSSYILGNSSEIGSVGTAATATAPATADIAVKNAFIIGNTSKISDAAAEGGLIYGSNAEVTKKNGLALGNSTSVSVADGVALGSNSVADTDKDVAGYDPGTGEASAKTTDPTWQSTAAAVSVGGGTVDGKTVTRQITDVAAGYQDTDAVNVAQLKAARVELKDGTNTTVTSTTDPTDGHTIYKVDADNPVHFYSVNSIDSTKGNYDNKGAKGADALAAGVDAKAAGDNAIAIGTESRAKEDGSIAIGNGAKAKESDSIAIGTGATAKGVGSIALGRKGATAVGRDAMAWGSNTKAKGDESTAWGTKTKAKGDGSTAFGLETVAKGDYSTVWGEKTKATGESATAWGLWTVAKGDDATAWGNRAKAVGVDSTAWGIETKAKGLASTAFGYYTKAKGDMSVAWGSGSQAIGNSSTAFGITSTAYGRNSLAALGGTTGSETDEITAVSSVAIGKNAVAAKDHTYAIGQDALAQDENTIAMGNSVVATGKNAVAIGSGEITRQIGTLIETDRPGEPTEYSFTDGNGKAREIQEDEAGIYYENDEGTKIYLNKNEIVKRTDNSDDYDAEDLITTTTYLITEAKNPAQASGENAIALGTSANASGKNSIAAGTRSAASAENTIALGNNASATVAGGVALGSTTVAQRAANNGGDTSNTGYDPSTGKNYDGEGKTGATWLSTLGAVSVGGAAGDTDAAIGTAATATRQITGVAAGTADTDAVNVAQLKKVAEAAGGALKFGGDNTTPDTYIERKSGQALDIKGGANTEPANLTDGNIAVVSNGRDTLNIKLAKDVDLTEAGSLKVGKTKIEDAGITIQPASGSVLTKFTNAGISAGNQQINNVAAGTADTDAVNVSQLNAVKEEAIGSVKLKFEGESGGTLERGNNETLQIVGDGTNITTKTADDQIQIELSKDLNVNSVTAGNTVINNDGVTTNKVTVGDTTVNSDGLTIDGGPSVTRDGMDAGGKKITNVAAGTADTDAVNVAQLREATAGTRTKVEGGTNIASVDTTTEAGGLTIYTVNADGAKVSAADGGAVTVTGAKDANNVTDYKVDLSDTAKASLDKVEKDGITFAGDMGTSDKIKLGDTLNIKGGASGELSDGNIGVEADGDTLNIKLAKDIKGVETLQVNKSVKAGDNITIDGENTKLTVGNTTIEDNKLTMGDTVITNSGVTANTFKAGDTTVNSDGVTINGGPSVTKTGVDAGGQKVTNVAPGEADTDAANMGQLYQVAENAGAAINNVSNEVNRLDSRMKKGLAGAAALAALHPMDFDPDDKLTFAAGMGNYRGQNAAAIGAFYRPDEKIMFSVGGTVGNGENMVNAGVSFALDRVNRVTTSRTAMAHEIVELKKHIAHQDSQIAQLTQLVNKLVGPEQQIQNTSMFPDVPENHWAYAYLEDLQKRGIVEGYPDGQFRGDRSMTRYEFAALLDRALRKGEELDARIAKEFEPELGRIYVERIKGQDNDRHKIERVRVNNTDTRTRDVYGTKIS